MYTINMLQEVNLLVDSLLLGIPLCSVWF